MIYSAEDKWREAKRETEMRERVYARWVVGGKMTMEEARRRTEIMRQIMQDYHKLMLEERLQ